MTNLIDGGERQIVEGREVSTIAGDVDLASATDLLQHCLERRIKQTRVETVPAKNASYCSEIASLCHPNFPH